MKEFGYIRLHDSRGDPLLVNIMSLDMDHLYSCNRDWRSSARISTFDGFMSSSLTVKESVSTIHTMIAEHDNYFIAEAFDLLKRSKVKHEMGEYYYGNN